MNLPLVFSLALSINQTTDYLAKKWGVIMIVIILVVGTGRLVKEVKKNSNLVIKFFLVDYLQKKVEE